MRRGLRVELVQKAGEVLPELQDQDSAGSRVYSVIVAVRTVRDACSCR